MTFNGYTNYETWAVCLWIDNDLSLQYEAEDIVIRKDLDDGSAAETFKQWIHNAAPDLGATLWADLLNGALSEVNWQEVAEHYHEGDE